MTRLMLCCSVLLLCACQSSHQQPQIAAETVPGKPGELPVKAFAALPLVQQLSLSPDGNFVAFLQNTDGDTALVTQDRSGKDVHVVLTSDNDKFRIRSYEWVNNERLLVRAWYPERRGDLKYVETRMLAINRDGTEEKADLIRIENSLVRRDNNSQFQDNFTVLPDDPKHVLLALDQRILGAPDVYKLDVYTGNKEMLSGNPGYVRSWVYDQQGRARVGVGIIGTNVRIVHRMNEADDWHTFAEFDGVKGGGPQPLGFGDDPDWLYLLANYQDKAAVFKTNLNAPSAPYELVYDDPKYDVNGELIYSADKKRAIGIDYNAESGKLVYWDKEAQQLQRRIDEALPHRTNRIISSRNKQHVLISSGAAYPPVYYWFDETKNHISIVIRTYPDLKPSLLARPETVHFKTRDGLDLEGYLTRPLKQTAGPSRTIIFPHGGPWSRDANDFNFWTQLMANRGWTVFQLNFRGSSGFGDEFEKSGFQRWGLEMQDDITDGVQWLIKEKIADPAKICIVGGSYGGYAALMGLAKTPELYRCGVSLAPVTDLVELLNHWSDMRYLDRHLHAGQAEARLGNWWSDRSRLKATSPVNLAAQFRTPLLLAHGVEDRTIDVSHSREMASALESAGLRDFQYLEMEDVDHHLSREQDRLQFFQAMDKFLRKYQ
ncbi:MAG: alpha/beta fold hydrolase [Methyloglobulus sp.]|nr:S9 family peptidase [Methyloglobulus sp.]